MKKLVLITMISGIFFGTKAQVKYADSVYATSSITVTKNLVYANGISILTGSPKNDSLRMDLYNPTGNTDLQRPMIIYLHTGNFLPRYINQQLTGARDDSATVSICTKLAQRGYVVAAISYRLGWLPTASTVEVRRGTIINAAYRGVQDLSAAVRYFKKHQKNGNTWKIDSTKIVVGGQGTGGYITNAFVTLDRQSEIRIPKFYDFTTNKWMVQDSAMLGDRKGFKIPGTNPALLVENHHGHTSNAAMAFNLGGALGDSSWLEDGEIPMIGVHGVHDLFAPYYNGIVAVPGTNPPLTVVDVSGTYVVIRKADSLGNNDCYHGVSDNITTQVNKVNDGIDGLFPIVGAANAHGPWEYWADTTYLRLYLTAGGLPQDAITKMFSNMYQANPLYGPMGGKKRAIRYIDSIVGYVAPRLRFCLFNLASTNGLDLSNEVVVSPNPSQGKISIINNATSHTLQKVNILDLNGRVVQNLKVSGNYSEHALYLPAGIYLVHMQFNDAIAIKKLIIN